MENFPGEINPSQTLSYMLWGQWPLQEALFRKVNVQIGYWKWDHISHLIGHIGYSVMGIIILPRIIKMKGRNLIWKSIQIQTLSRLKNELAAVVQMKSSELNSVQWCVCPDQNGAAVEEGGSSQALREVAFQWNVPPRINSNLTFPH
jgi:hypothetical protein